MTNPSSEAEVLLAIDIGTLNTRALLFDIVEGQYRLIASGEALTTAEAPISDIGSGVSQAVERLQTITGRVIFDREGRLVVPARMDGSGVDRVVATISAGPSLRFVVAGLLPEVSLESAQRLAAGTYGQIAETLWINDSRKTDAQIDAVLRARPDLVIVTGGTDRGAERSVNRLLEVIGLACYLLPGDQRPVVLYAGNTALAEKARESLQSFTTVHTAPNLRPDIDLEDLSPAQLEMARVVEEIRLEQVGGLREVAALAGGHVLPTGAAMLRFIRYLSRVVQENGKGVLGVDVGASATILAAAFAGRTHLQVEPAGLGAGAAALLKQPGFLADLQRWLPMEAAAADLRDYLAQKSIAPTLLPVNDLELALEQALARVLLQRAAQPLATSRSLIAAARSLGDGARSGGGLGLPYEPIIASGSVLRRAPTMGQALLMLLDGLQPHGVTTFVLDQNGLMPALGAAGEVNPILPVQVFESPAFLHLATVVSPVSSARPGTHVLRARLVRADGSESTYEVQQGSLQVLPLETGLAADLWLEPLGRTQLGLHRSGRGIKITGGVFGAVIDARGRPLRLPEDGGKRADLLKNWQWTLGG